MKANAATLAAVLQTRGLRIVSGGTDTHLVLVDLSPKGITGKRAEAVLEQAGITANKNAIPNDSPRPPEWVGLRLGSGAATTRGMKEAEFEALGHMIADLVDAEAAGDAQAAVGRCKTKAAALCAAFPAGCG